MAIKDGQIEVIDENGNKTLLEILFTYENEERKKQYVFCYEKDSPEDVMVFAYTDEGELFEIDDEEEYAEVEEVFNTYIDENEFQDK